MIPSPTHLNLNIFASVYVETTGPLVGFHDIFRICIIPLDNFYLPAKGVMPFLVGFQPIHEESPWLGRERYIHAKSTGVHPSMAPEVLSLWASRLPKQKDKKLVPIGYNWPFASAFMKTLFGPDVFDEVFFESSRDVMGVASYVNDCCNLNVEDIPFPRPGLVSICNRLNVQIDEPHDSLNLARATANAYRASLKRMFKGVVM
jgi:hypothetical protein